MNVLRVFAFCLYVQASAAFKSFEIDYEHDRFLKDGEPFRYVSGSVHYYRVPRELWRDRLTKLRLAGLNAVSTYIEWSTHEPEPGRFTQLEDVTDFVKLAQDVGLLVILRPGPFICSERDFGGFPYWLLRDNPSMVIRTYDASYMKLVDRYLSNVLPEITPLLYSNGGPVIMVQVENEYGTDHCDKNYLTWLRDTFKRYLRDPVILFTTDSPQQNLTECGKIEGVYATVDFHPGDDAEVVAFAGQRRVEPRGPLVNSEFYPGWMDIWSEPHSTYHDTAKVVKTLKQILDTGASVNLYMFHGGTNFGYKNAAFGNGLDLTVTTSYNMNAPISEAGDPTDKYYAIRDLLSNYLPLPAGEVPKPAPKFHIDRVQMRACASLSDIMGKYSTIRISQFPLTFGQLEVDGGYVIYKTTVNFKPRDPSELAIPGLKDRAQVIIDGQLIGTLSRTDNILTMPLRLSQGSELIVLVENQGRSNVGLGMAADSDKGIIGNVSLGSQVLTDWTHYHNFLNIECSSRKTWAPTAPAIYAGSFVIPEGCQGLDTFLRLDGWGKGVAFINGINIGRYWPDEGPQVTLYVPHVWLHHNSSNYIYLFETERAPCEDQDTCFTSFRNVHVLNGQTPEAGTSELPYFG
ncbi:Beta-galactosidase [Halotydeus destructor]|nr:Beta-galactosidase [Halotydeus destructor]